MRAITLAGVCHCCGSAGPVWSCRPTVLDLETELREADTTLPPLCDRCEFAQRRWDVWEFCRRHPAVMAYPYDEPPPASPPIRKAPQ